MAEITESAVSLVFHLDENRMTTRMITAQSDVKQTLEPSIAYLCRIAQ